MHYGGRVTDEYDQELFVMYAAKLLSDEKFRPSFTFNSCAAVYNNRKPEGFKIHVNHSALETIRWVRPSSSASTQTQI